MKQKIAFFLFFFFSLKSKFTVGWMIRKHMACVLHLTVCPIYCASFVEITLVRRTRIFAHK